MNFEDFIIEPQPIKTESWQIGSKIMREIPESGLALLFVSDFRGAGRSAKMLDFSMVRRNFYHLSGYDFDIPIADLGDLVSGRTPQDTHYILQEVASACFQKNTVPIVVGGSNDFAYSLFSALNLHQENVNYTQISNTVSLANDGEDLDEKNYLVRILGSKNFSLKNFHLLGYQKHLNELDSVKLIKEVEFDIIRLASMMNSTEKAEPFFRKADLVTVNCDAVESFSDAFSLHPQINGLNRREICAYMKEAGMSENLKAAAVFNFNFESDNPLNHQLLSQMLWYLLEGVNIRKSHPEERHYETYYVMVGEQNYTFKRDSFTNLWYFGDDEDIENCVPCSREDFDMAKKGYLDRRFSKLT